MTTGFLVRSFLVWIGWLIGVSCLGYMIIYALIVLITHKGAL